jgi:antitoxin (DNA-binding transcriptional repressor) of toxin-antitoxin stability system
MSQKVTATEAARNFSELLNRVRYERETFVILRGGEAVGQLGPMESRRRITLRDLLAALELVEKPDQQFADDLEKIQAEQPLAGESPWPS